MPYIHPDSRKKFDEHIDRLIKEISYDGAQQVDIAGNLNYCITRLILGVVIEKLNGVRYWICPLVRGVLQDVGDEMYRRLFRVYENTKIEQYGDIPEYIKLKELIDNHDKK